MSLYHETVSILSKPSSQGGNLRTWVFGEKDLRAPPQQVYALATESCKWSPVLKEVIEKSGLLQLERKLTPILSVLLVHDLILSKSGIALPSSHGLRVSIERHKARLHAEFTRVRLRWKLGSVGALRQEVESAYARDSRTYPRWVRVNTLLTTTKKQLETTFEGFVQVSTVGDVITGQGKSLRVDEHVPDLIAISPDFEITKTDAYKAGLIILQDKASCFPACLLNPLPSDGHVIDSCAAPGNKTTHLAAIVQARANETSNPIPKVLAFEKDCQRARTLEKMITTAGATDIVSINHGRDFLKVDPEDSCYRQVGCLLLDPSCSGSGIVGRDTRPSIQLPKLQGSDGHEQGKSRDRKRKRVAEPESDPTNSLVIDDDGSTILYASEPELEKRLGALSSFQLALLLHAFKFPSAEKITYSTCSVHTKENEGVINKALQSDVAKARGWRILCREDQIDGMRRWPVRGSLEGAAGNMKVSEACIRSYKDDGRGVMGFFVAGFVRDGQGQTLSNGNHLEHIQDHVLELENTAEVLKELRYNTEFHEDETQHESDNEEWGGFSD